MFFDTLVWNQREEVISWLRFKYNDLPYADAEDIYQEASWELWKKLCDMDDWKGESMIGMLKAICRNMHSHWKRGRMWNDEWDDKFYPQDDGVETDYGYISSGTARMMLKEHMYEMLELLEPKDRSLMEMHLQNVRMDKIAQQLGFRNAQVARNRKCKIVVKLCKEINAQAANACASLFIYVSKFGNKLCNVHHLPCWGLGFTGRTCRGLSRRCHWVQRSRRVPLRSSVL